MKVQNNAHFWGVIDDEGHLEHCSRCGRIKAYKDGEWKLLPKRINIMNVLTESY